MLIIVSSIKIGKGEWLMSSALAIVNKFFPGVKHVQDAKAPIDIEVTRGDNTSATRRSHKTCAMAVACKRKLKLDGVIISLKTAYLVKGSKATRFRLGEHTSREVITFDRDGGFSPGEYSLLLPGPGHKLGKHQGGKGGSNNKSSHRRVQVHRLTKGVRTVLGSKMAAE